jgi:hypothetical protein
VCKVDGREVGRKRASDPNAGAYLQRLASFYLGDGKSMTVDYEEDPTGGLLASLGL